MRKKPNFVIFYADDLGYGDLGCYGSDAMKTPHLDALARDGVRFTNWYSNASVCSPSRAALLTGRYPARTGVSQILGGKRGTTGLPTTERTLATVLRSNGYDTGMFGKWHLGVTPEHGPNAHGFEEFTGFLAGCVDYYSHIFYWGQGGGVNPVHDLWNNEKEIWENGRYMTELITERAVDYVRRHAEHPFFLYVPYNAPHYPMHAPRAYVDRFPSLPPDRRVMAAMIAAMDDGVGEIVAALKEENVYEYTVIFFSSDNGPSTESRNFLDGKEDLYYGGSAGVFRGHKGSLFDGGIREPAILTYPAAIAGGQICDELCMTMDIVPTFLGLAQCSVSEEGHFDGCDILPVAAHGAASPHERVFWEYGKQLAVREGDWKLVLNGRLDFGRPAAEIVHLSNLAEDPGERVNRADDEPERVARMRTAVEQWVDTVSNR